jgi:hypothetical protein
VPADERHVALPEPLADFTIVELESLQEAAPLYTSHGLLRHSQPLRDRSLVHRHEA